MAVTSLAGPGLETGREAAWQLAGAKRTPSGSEHLAYLSYLGSDTSPSPLLNPHRRGARTTRLPLRYAQALSQLLSRSIGDGP